MSGAMPKDAPIGVISALSEEAAHFADGFTETGRETIGGSLFRAGQLDGVAVVVVECGIGKVNAAVVATVLLTRFGCRALVFSGVAGGLHEGLRVGDVVLADRLIAHDYGALTAGAIKAYQPGVPPLPGFDDTVGYPVDGDLIGRLRSALETVSLPPLSAQATGGDPHVPVLHVGTVLTGDTFLNCPETRDRLHITHGGLAVEMEGAAIAQVADRFDGVPVVVIRALSDQAGEDSHLSFADFVREVAGVAALLVRKAVTVI